MKSVNEIVREPSHPWRERRAGTRTICPVSSILILMLSHESALPFSSLWLYVTRITQMGNHRDVYLEHAALHTNAYLHQEKVSVSLSTCKALLLRRNLKRLTMGSFLWCNGTSPTMTLIPRLLDPAVILYFWWPFTFLTSPGPLSSGSIYYYYNPHCGFISLITGCFLQARRKLIS